MGLPSVTKQPNDSRLYSMDFAALLATGETLSGVTSVTITPTTASMLTAGSPTYSGNLAQVRLTGGLSGTRYKVTFVVTTSLSNTLEAEGLVQLTNT